MTTRQPPNAMDPFLCRLAESWPTELWQNGSVLVAVSGGPDSIALLRGLLALQPDGQRILAAHFHHGLRGPAADADQRFVLRTCEALHVRCFSGQTTREAVAEQQAGAGFEAAARKLRYQFLVQSAEQVGARYVATGHTADDQAETVLHHVLRGTGLAGLGGIPPARRASEAVTIVRPLLAVSRVEVLAYLNRLDQSFQLDLTNQDRRFTRNRLRHNILPHLERDFHPHVRQALVRLGQIAREAQQSFAACLAPLLERHVRRHRDAAAVHVEIECHAGLLQLTAHLQREFFVAIWRQNRWPRRHMAFRHWQQLSHLLVDRSAPPLTLPAAIRATREGDQIRLVRPVKLTQADGPG